MYNLNPERSTFQGKLKAFDFKPNALENKVNVSKFEVCILPEIIPK